MTDPSPRKAGRPPTGDTPASEHIHLRSTGKRKSHYVRTAQAEGKTLAAWAFAALDKASGYQGSP